MNGYRQPTPQELAQAANNMLDNPDLHMLLLYRCEEVKEDMASCVDPKEVMAAHAEYNSLKDFGQWIATLASQTLRG